MSFALRFLSRFKFTDHVYPYSVILVIVIIETTFFQDKFGVNLESPRGAPVDHNDDQLHMIVYLQVAIISQALIFVTRSHGFFFMERPSYALMAAFCLAQLVSSIIAGFADWGFTDIKHISGGWIGIVWVWNIVWFLPLDLIKFAMKATVIKYLRERHLRAVRAAGAAGAEGGVPLTRTKSRAESILSAGYKSRTRILDRVANRIGFGGRVTIRDNELQRFGTRQAQEAGSQLARHPSRTSGV